MDFAIRSSVALREMGFVLSLGFMLSLTSCGTTSPMKPAAGEAVDLTRYERLLVENFQDEFSAKARPKERAEKQAEAEKVCEHFADRIAVAVRAAGGFAEVVREGERDAQTLVINGAIQRYEEGSAALRLFIGLGAGSSYFDARVDLVDGASGVVIGSWSVDRNSWGLGGVIASSQTTEAFMKKAAKKIGEELSAAKKEGVFDPKAPKKSADE